MVALAVLLLATFVQSSTAYGTGHPTTHCNQKTPNHGRSSRVQGGGLAYQVTATQIQMGPCSIRACVETMPKGSQSHYEGFFLKALPCDIPVDFANFIGSFSLDSGTTVAKTICPDNSAVTHTNSNNRLTKQCATWTPKSGGTCPRCVHLCATVVKDFELYHYDVCTTITVCIYAFSIVQSNNCVYSVERANPNATFTAHHYTTNYYYY
jgi:hypothetical protein